MKILHIVGTLNAGGIEKIVSQLAIYQKIQQDQNPIIACALRKEGLFIDPIERAGIPIVELGYSRKHPLDLTRKLLRLFSMEHPDIIHSHVNFSLLFQGLPRLIYPIPLVYTQHSMSKYSQSKSFRLRAFGGFSIIKRKPFRHTAVSKYAANYATGIYPTKVSDITVIYNGINHQDFRFDEEKRRNVRSEWGISEDQIVIGCVGRLDPVKGYDILLKSFALLVKNDPSVKAQLVIVGTGNQFSDLSRLSEDLGIAEQVHWLGTSNSVPAVLSGFDIYVQTSRWETFSLTMLEGLANGLPVITTRNSGISEFSFFGDQLIIEESLDPRIFADHLQEQMKIHRVRGRLSKRFPEVVYLEIYVRKISGNL